jgi:hypothetical protein
MDRVAAVLPSVGEIDPAGCPGPGPVTGTGARQRGSAGTRRSRRSRSWPGRWSRGPCVRAAVRLFTADEAYGDNGPLRDWLEENKVAHVVAVSCDHWVPAGAGRAIRAGKLAAKVPARCWQRHSCGPGSKGERLYDWALAGAGPDRYLTLAKARA